MSEVGNVYLVENFSYSVIYLPKIINIDGHLMKFWHKQFVQLFMRHGVHKSWLFELWKNGLRCGTSIQIGSGEEYNRISSPKTSRVKGRHMFAMENV